jgi:Ser-tRNA(Ala) deacylase AlaX
MNQEETIPKYWESPYSKEIEATITQVDNNRLQFNQTIFYPGGGGQLHDTGTIIYSDYELPVFHVYKDETGIWHEIKKDKSVVFEVGKKVTLKLNWNRRYSFMRSHTSQHLLTSVLIAKFGCETTKSNFEEGKIEIEVDKQLQISEIIQAFDEVNQIIKHGDEVKSIIVDQASFIKEYKAKTTKIRGKSPEEETVRLIQLGEEAYDIVGCGGTHVKNLSEIKGIVLDSVKGKIIKYFIDEQAFAFANKQRAVLIELEEITEKKDRKLVEMVINKIKSAEILLQGNVRLLKMVFRNIKTWSEEVGGKQITLLELPEIDRQIIQSSAKELGKDSLLGLLGSNDILYVLSTIDTLPADEIVKRFSSKTGSRGGGSKAFSQVSVKNIEVPLSILREIIKEF